MKKESSYCPTCGQPTTYRISPEWLMGHFSGKFAGMLAALIEARRHKRGLSPEELAQAATMNHDAPMTPTTIGTMRVFITHNRKKLRKLGWAILGPQATKTGYWLVPIEDE